MLAHAAIMSLVPHAAFVLVYCAALPELDLTILSRRLRLRSSTLLLCCSALPATQSMK